MKQDKPVNIAIIGAGISGLRVAYLIAKSLHNRINIITIFDKQEKIGGVLQNTKSEGFLLEHGAQGVLLSREAFQKCINELEIQSRVVLPNGKEQTRYLLTENSYVPLRLSLIQLKKNGLLGIKDFIRILSEFFLKKPLKQNMNETLHAFFVRHFWKKFCRYFSCFPIIRYLGRSIP